MSTKATMSAAMLILVCGDHKMYFDIAGSCVLDKLPFPVVLLCSRASEQAFSASGSALEMHRAQWSDFELVKIQTQNIAANREIFAVATMNEALMELAAELRAQFNLPGMREEVKYFRNKVLMKQRLRACGINVPEFAECLDKTNVVQLQAKHQKLVFKPIDGLGSRDVSFINSVEELESWYANETSPEQYEAEQFIAGRMYHVNDIVRDGRVILSAAAAYTPGMASIDYRRGPPLVTVMLEDTKLKQRLSNYSANIIEKLGLQYGVTHLECFITEQNEIILCEIAARPAGGGIIQMMESQYGIHYAYAALLLEAGEGNKIKVKECSENKIYGLMGFRTAEAGKVDSIAPVTAFEEPWIRFATTYYEKGNFVRAAKQSSDFLCLLVFGAKDIEEFSERQIILQERFNGALAIKPMSQLMNPKKNLEVKI
jgi:D-alanine-D-alanine ligase-like ATP-grasp enzyme